MPYIKKTYRDELKEFTDMIEEFPLANPGEINYIITKVLQKYEAHKGTSYQVFNDITGALMNCYNEYYRRRIAPYEDQKIQEHGYVS